MLAESIQDFSNSRKLNQVASGVHHPLSRMISVMIVGDNLLLRRSLHTWLNFYNLSSLCQFNLVGEAICAKQAIKLAQQHPPALILLDLDLSQGREEGLATLIDLSQLAEKPKVLVLSDRREDAYIFRVMQAGAFGYILKEHLPAQLHPGITTVSNGQIYLCPEIATKFFRMFHLNEGRSLPDSNPYNLTNREQEVLQLLVEGAGNQTIAKDLCVTVATVKAHLTAIFEKLEVDSRSRAIVKALKLGLV